MPSEITSTYKLRVKGSSTKQFINSLAEAPISCEAVSGELILKLQSMVMTKELRIITQAFGTYTENVISCQDQAAVAFGLTRMLSLLWI